ncbi:hypothetical protein C8F04DRAFT_1123238 [Mycena alexandri]|uniref:Uncharacterized protein n=1 Tax=Mycena alexandri TaxID=1745969 RepID=A0AAD6SHB1_9AGAR|nr:hypothetical protein C8F04DRAFT_1123238 [Mycena alexandri]
MFTGLLPPLIVCMGMSVTIFVRHIVCALILFATAIPKVSAALNNATLVAGSSDNITFSGGGWQGPGNWQGLDPENESCSTSPGIYSWTPGASVSVIFKGIAIYFVGWNNSRNGVYQPYLDGVPDSPVSAYIPAPISGPWVCNVIQYTRTGLANMQHNLTMALLTDDPGDIGVPGMSISGVIVTTEEHELPLSIPTVIPTSILSVAPNNTSAALTLTDTNGVIVPTPSDTSRSLNSTQVVGTTSAVSTSTSNVFSTIGTATIPELSGAPAVAASNGSVSDQLRPVSTGTPSVTASFGTTSTITVLSTTTGTPTPSDDSQSLSSKKFIESGTVPFSTTNTTSASTTSTVTVTVASTQILPAPTTAIAGTGVIFSTTSSKAAASPAVANTGPVRVISSSLRLITPVSSTAIAGIPGGATSSSTASTIPVSLQNTGSTAFSNTGPAGMMLSSRRGSTPSPGSRTVIPSTLGGTRSFLGAGTIFVSSMPIIAPSGESVSSGMAAPTVKAILATPTGRSSSTPELTTVPVTVSPTTTISPLNRAGSSGPPTSSSILFSATDQGRVAPAITSDRSSPFTSLDINIPVSSTPSDERPVLPMSKNGSSASTTVPGPTANVLVSGESVSHTATIAGSVVGAIVGLATILGLISFASWAHQISHAKKASKPGAFKSKAHEFNFVIPPYLPDRKPQKSSFNSFQVRYLAGYPPISTKFHRLR